MKAKHFLRHSLSIRNYTLFCFLTTCFILTNIPNKEFSIAPLALHFDSLDFMNFVEK